MKSKLLVLFIVLGIFVFLAFNSVALANFYNNYSDAGVPLTFGNCQSDPGYLSLPTCNFGIENLIIDILFAFVISGIVIYSTLRFSK